SYDPLMRDDRRAPPAQGVVQDSQRARWTWWTWTRRIVGGVLIACAVIAATHTADVDVRSRSVSCRRMNAVGVVDGVARSLDHAAAVACADVASSSMKGALIFGVIGVVLLALPRRRVRPPAGVAIVDRGAVADGVACSPVGDGVGSRAVVVSSPPMRVLPDG